MKCKKWPFRPDHITNDGEKAPKDSPLMKLLGDGIISNEHLQGIETAICAKLRYPTTIMEFAPERKGKAAEKVVPVRTDSPLMDQAEEPFGFHPPCRKSGKLFILE